MMRYMLSRYGHLSTADTGTDVAHAVVITNLLVLIVGIALTILRGIHHNFAPLVLIGSNQGATITGGYHLVPVERQHIILTKRTQHLTIPATTEALSSILHYRNSVLVGNLHNAVNLIQALTINLTSYIIPNTSSWHKHIRAKSPNTF